jgi:AcrR family transcriptional regulator
MKSRSRYHSPLRQAQAAATSERILVACASLMESGADLTYGAISRAAGVQERTVYRHFPTKADLQLGLWGWITSRLTRTSFTARSTDELVTDMRRAFAGFDASAPLVQSMLHSPQGVEVRVRQQPARRAMFAACVQAAVPEAPAEVRERAAAALQVLYSAPSWDLLRTFWQMDAAQAADTVELAIRSLLAGLPAVSQSQPGPSAAGPGATASRQAPAAGARSRGRSQQARAETERGPAQQERTPS